MTLSLNLPADTKSMEITESGSRSRPFFLTRHNIGRLSSGLKAAKVLVAAVLQMPDQNHSGSAHGTDSGKSNETDAVHKPMPSATGAQTADPSSRLSLVADGSGAFGDEIRFPSQEHESTDSDSNSDGGVFLA